MQIEYFEELDELYLYNWDRYLATNNNNWFIKGFDGRQKIISNEKLIELEAKFQDSYFNLLNDASFMIKLQKWAKIEALNTKYNAIITILNRLKIGFSLDQQEIRAKLVTTLNKAGFKISIMGDYEEDLKEIDTVFNKAQSIKTQIDIIQAELKEESIQEKQSLQKQLIIVSQGLQLGYRLNPKEISVVEWIEMSKMMNEKSKQN